MQTVAASVILEDAHRLMGEDVTQLDEPRREQEARTGLSLALQEMWDAWWWQELMTLTPQNLRATYASGTTYAAGDEVYYPATGKYYQCLQATTGHAPEEVEYWLEAALSYTAEDFTARVYEYGELARDPASGLVYARIAKSLTIVGAGSPFLQDSPAFTKFPPGVYYTAVIPPSGSIVATGDSWQTGDPAYDFFAFYLRYNADAGLWILGRGPTWAISGASPTLVGTYSSEHNTASNNPAGTVSWMVADAPPSANWRAVSNFVPDLDTGRKVRMISRLKPTQTNNPGEYDFIETVEGVELMEIPTSTPWVWARRVTPVLTGDDFSSATLYTATPAADLVFDS